MNRRPIFETYWLVDDEQIYDIRVVGERVAAGAVAKEITAMAQLEAWQNRQLAERWHAEAIERYNKLLAEQQYRSSPDGKAALVLREAAAHGSRVTLCGPHDAAFDELDEFSPQHTDVFRR